MAVLSEAGRSAVKRSQLVPAVVDHAVSALEPQGHGEAGKCTDDVKQLSAAFILRMSVSGLLTTMKP
jgi:hypothetical protein